MRVLERLPVRRAIPAKFAARSIEECLQGEATQFTQAEEYTGLVHNDPLRCDLN